MHRLYELPTLSTVSYSTSLPLFILAALGKFRLTPLKALATLLVTQTTWQFANRLYIKYLERELRKSRLRTKRLEREIRRLNRVARRADEEIERLEEEGRWWRDGWHFEGDV
ncbi:hypothetical protein K504DRAFT_460923 [Pleomassaria siparia CBS 279.74]|uniref:Uncharacterized protein n=1 Tax=Pleomassaria siparia CBS 279.74 TaxID=1314801 RepID=A0A6G1JX78_9PLEO|nr:hypothetical protein K504DRAFT_460923 [Pleomassaria siparia CBS 279.74]